MHLIIKINFVEITMKKKLTPFLIMLTLPALVLSGNQADGENNLKETAIGFSKVVKMDFEQALKSIKVELKKEKFGVLTEVNIKAVMKKKLDVDFKPYQILGVCNPPLAYKSLTAEEEIGLLLPCKFIVYVNEQNQTVIAAVDPLKMMQGVENDALSEVAKVVQSKFKDVISRLN